jgi:hypothetical protein
MGISTVMDRQYGKIVFFWGLLFSICCFKKLERKALPMHEH